ncbi:MAG: hypothetical protein F7B17_05515 [Desulfurococcales archaeon]|nr:hypothetical protein [Desulfurococcales archaeon]
MAARVVSFKWHDCGYAIVLSSEHGLKVEFENLKLEFSQREVSVEGVYGGLREHQLDQRGSRKVVYIDLAFQARGVKTPRGVVYQREAEMGMGAFGVVFSPLEPIGSYLTIYPPPGSLYDYATIAPDKIALFMIGRRQVYLMEEDRVRKLIFV